MDISKIDKFMDKAHEFAEKGGEYIQRQVRALPDEKIIRLAQGGNMAAQEEADRRHLDY